MAKSILSKSTYIRGLQCEKSLFLYKNNYKDRDKLSSEQLETFKRGTNIGILAQELFPKGINVAPSHPSKYFEAVLKTKELIANKHAVIYEAAFLENDVYVALDILEFKDNKWIAYEVKSSLKISDTYIEDAALQFSIINKSGIELDDFFIIHINPNYVLNENFNLNDFFIFQSVKEVVIEKQIAVNQKIDDLKTVATSKDLPKTEIGIHCITPYSCDFYNYCRKEIPTLSIFNLNGISNKDKYELYNDGKYLLSEIVNQDIDEAIEHQINSFTSNKIYVDSDLKNTINDAKNILFFDVIDIRRAMPFLNNTKPFESIPICLSFSEFEDEQIAYTSKTLSLSELKRKQIPNSIIKNIENAELLVVYDKENFINFCDFFNIDSKKENVFSIKDILEESKFIHPKLKGDLSFNNLIINFNPGFFFSKLPIKNIETVREKIFESYFENRIQFEDENNPIDEYAKQRCRTLEKTVFLMMK